MKMSGILVLQFSSQDRFALFIAVVAVEISCEHDKATRPSVLNHEVSDRHCRAKELVSVAQT